MELRPLPLNTWMVVERLTPHRGRAVSVHATQADAEAERDRRNTRLAHPRFDACMAFLPVAERMGCSPLRGAF
jgi:hypothetical protein